MGHEEGRVRKAADGVTFVFDYFLKDHLGNVRMMLTEESKTDVYPTLDWEGTAGTQSVANEDAVWDNSTGGAVGVATNRVAKPANMGTSGTNGSYSGYVKKTSPGGAIGAAKLLKVMSGDQINTSVDYYWPSATVSNSNANGISTLTTSLLSILANTAGVSAAVKGAIPTVNSGLTADPNIISKITTPENNSSGSTQPKAYLHVLLFNEQFQFDNVNSVVLQIGTTANVVATLTQTVTVKRNGYAYIYFSNESNNDVYFDNFKLTDVRGQILQESHYNPWGEKLSGISSQAMAFGGTTNRYLYNGKEQQAQEFSDGTGLEEYDYGARMYDAQLGRWNVIDPLADKSRRWSPYNYAYDNPIRFIDPDGMASALYQMYGGAGGTNDEITGYSANPEIKEDINEHVPEMNIEFGTDDKKEELKSDPLDKNGGEQPNYEKIPRDGRYIAGYAGGGDDNKKKGDGDKRTLPDMKENPPDHPGYKPPKSGDQWVRNPNGRGMGWLDKKGSVWVPDDHNGTHAPHWDVQDPKGGGYTPVYPSVETTVTVGVGAVIGIVIWETVKWSGAVLAAPETFGGSLVLAGATP